MESMKTLSSDKKIARIAVDASLAGVALLLSMVEALFPIAALPLPGFKLGLANIAITVAAFRYSYVDAAAVSLVRVIITFLLFGSPTSLLFSLMGGTLVIITLLLIRKTKLSRQLSFVGVSLLCALAHNAGQLIASTWLVGSAVLSYIPALSAASLIYGTINGIILCLLPNKIYKR